LQEYLEEARAAIKKEVEKILFKIRKRHSRGKKYNVYLVMISSKFKKNCIRFSSRIIKNKDCFSYP
jgi:hypothetical protein